MLDSLTQRLSSVIKTMRGHARLTEDNVGEALREVYRRDATALRDFGFEFNSALTLGGQIRGEAPRLQPQ